MSTLEHTTDITQLGRDVSRRHSADICAVIEQKPLEATFQKAMRARY
jgi:hypothetical protein